VCNKTNTHFGFFVGAALAAVALILSINALVSGALTGAGADMSDAAIAARIAPVAQLNTGAVVEVAAPAAAAVTAPAESVATPAESVATTAPAAPAGRSGDAVYTAHCFMCHGTGAAGAPKLGDAAAWAPRVATGMDALMNSALSGKNAMPPRGLCGTCSDDELKGAIEYMVNNSK
jgi:cytochrome c5